MGTIEHRLHCRCNVPTGGWSSRPPKALLAERSIGKERLKLLTTTGLLAVRVPGLPKRAMDTLHWGMAPGDDMPTDVTWYIDGSMLNPRRKRLATGGFGVAAVSRSGDLCAWGWGVPPHWCDSASAAEAWALSIVLRLSPGHSYIVTDCLGLVNTARQGTPAAMTSKKHLARVWKHIANSLDGKLEVLTQGNALVWMPAHRSATAIGNARKSNHKFVTARDWRANRLVDGLAKHAASQGAAPQSTVDLINSAEFLARHAAAQLAVATYNANNHFTTKVKPDGTVVGCTLRDSQPAPKTVKSRGLKPLKASLPTAAQPPPASATEEPSTSDSSSSDHITRQMARAKARKLARNREAERLSDAANAVLHAPRRNAREELIDTHRRQMLGKSLQEQIVDAPFDDWGGFLHLGSGGPSSSFVNSEDECRTITFSGYVC